MDRSLNDIEFDYSPIFQLPGEYLTTEQIIKTQSKPRDIVPGVCFESSVGMIVAPPYVGKTLLLMDLGLALATNQSWLKWKPISQVPAIIYALDSPGWESREQAECLMAGRGIDPNTPWPFALVTRELAEQMRPCDIDGEPRMKEKILGPVDIMNPRWFEHMVTVANGFGARLIGLDSFSKIHSRDENDRKQMEEVMKQIARLAMMTRAHVLVLHHTPVIDRGESVYAGRGSSVIGASVDFKAVITKKTPKDCQVYIVKGRGSDEGDSEFRITKERLAHPTCERAVRWGVVEESDEPSKKDAAWAYVKDMLTEHGTMSRVGLCTEAEETGINNLNNYLYGFKNRGLIQSPSRGTFQLTSKGRKL